MTTRTFHRKRVQAGAIGNATYTQRYETEAEVTEKVECNGRVAIEIKAKVESDSLMSDSQGFEILLLDDNDSLVTILHHTIAAGGIDWCEFTESVFGESKELGKVVRAVVRPS